MGVFNGPASAIEDNRNKVNEINEQSTEKQYLSALGAYKLQQQIRDYANNNFANALKGSKTGAEVTFSDVSPLDHDIKVKLSGKGVKLYRSGKNLFDQSIVGEKTLHGVTYKYLPDEDCILINGTSTANGSANKKFPIPHKCEVDAYYTITTKYVSGKVTRPSGTYAVAYFGGGDTPEQNSNWRDCSLYEYDYKETSKMTKKYISWFWFYVNPGVSFDNYKVKIQLEKGYTQANYEKYVAPTECVVNTDGTANVPSLYPTTRLYTDTEGVTIEAEYNRDINKAFAELTNALISLGGNV